MDNEEREAMPVAIGSECSAGLGACECLHWANHDLGQMILTGHHSECPKSPTGMAATRELLTKLVRGIEHWASQEDGVPDEIWDAYAQAKAVIGESA